jgi:hypothetical protein
VPSQEEQRVLAVLASDLKPSGEEQIMNLRATALWRALGTAAILGPAVALAAPGSHAGAARAATVQAATVQPTTVRTATSACATPGLDVWLNTQGDGTAGTTYYNLEFTNLSGSSCTLYGYPGVSGVTLAGTQLGSAASRNGTTPHTVTLASGATASATLGIADVGAFPAAKCQMTTAAGLRVYPPGQTRSRVAPFPFYACAKSGELYLSIGPVQG